MGVVFFSYMQITEKHWVIMGGGLLIAVVAAFGWSNFAQAPVVAPPTVELGTASSTEPAATPAEKPIVRAPMFSVSPADTIASWSFENAYTGDTALIARADAEITRLTNLLGTKQYTDYILYVSIANQYDLLGDGANEFTFLKKALAIDSATTGLAWYNAGHLFSRLGAYATARRAFESAVAAEPIQQYVQALADFNATHRAGQ